MKRKTEGTKLNNSGFSLLEVLIAMVILCLVSIPLLHSFFTTAKTNGRAKIMMRATNCAENLLESAEYKSVEDLVAHYDASDDNTVTANFGYARWGQLTTGQTVDAAESDGAYLIEIGNEADIPVALPDEYKVYMMLDPNLYPNANGLNVADVKSISVSDTAVYEMSALYDDSIYKKFEEWNKIAAEDESVLYIDAPGGTDYFKENLTRTMEISIDKQGTELDEAGNTVDLLKVNLNIRYYFRNKNQYRNYLPESRKEYIEETQELYNNLSTKEPLNGIYLFYQPRYLATKMGNKDNIIINNPDNVEVNLMLAPQIGAADASYKSQYFNSVSGPNVTVVENPSGGINADADAALTLFTNLSTIAPYSAIDNGGYVVQNANILCNLAYQNLAGTQKVTGDNAAICLDARNLDGKTLTGSKVKKRIYKIAVAIVDQQGTVLVELDGTKLE